MTAPHLAHAVTFRVQRYRRAKRGVRRALGRASQEHKCARTCALHYIRFEIYVNPIMVHAAGSHQSVNKQRPFCPRRGVVR